LTTSDDNGASTARAPRLRPPAALLLILVACALAYAPGLGGPLFFDDVPNLSENRSLLQLDATRFDDWRLAVFSADSGLLHRPLALLSFARDRVLAGELAPRALKLTNLLLHLAAGVLLYRLCRALLRAPALAATPLLAGRAEWIAVLAAALWLLHPLQVSTVLYAVQRMTQLSALFVLLGLLVYTRYRLRWAVRGAASGELLGAALWLLLIGAAGVLCKENGALLPWLLLVVEVFLFRGAWAGGEHPGLRRAAWLLLAAPLLFLVLFVLFDPGLLEGRYARREFDLAERLLTQSRVLWHYLSWLLLPDITAMGFHHDDIPLSRDLFSPPTTALALGGWLLALLCALLLQRRYPLAGFALLFFLVGHSMESTVWPLEMVFEHRNYLPAAGLCLAAAAAVFALGARIRWWRPAVAGALIALCLLGLLSLRTVSWGDEIRLARHNVVNHPESPRANFFYANALLRALQESPDDASQQARLNEEERRAYAVTARQHFLRMYELDPRAMTAPVKLLQMDHSFFPGLPDAPDWLGVLAAQARERALHPSDRTALDALVDYAAAELDGDARRRVLGLLATLDRRYPDRAWLYAMRYRLLASLPAYTREDRLALLRAGVDAKPHVALLYPYLVREYGADDLPASYAAMGQWLRHDDLRREQATVLRIFNR